MTSAERSTSSPVSLKFGLLVVGAAAALSTHFAWRAKATNAFKASYATTWLTLGTATILYVQPDREELERKLRASASARESLTPVSCRGEGGADPGPAGRRGAGRRAKVNAMQKHEAGTKGSCTLCYHNIIESSIDYT
jgi:hypothetical protein